MAQALPARGSISVALLALALAGALPAAWSVPAAAATTFTVNQTGDASDLNIADRRCDTSPAAGRQCTLRAAIEEANDTLGADLITFNIVSSAAVKTISPASSLPTITDVLIIDGYTQPGASPNTLATGNDAVLNIQLNGNNAGVDAIGLRIEAADSTIKGLVINRFDSFGILVDSGATGNRIEGNFIGTNATGTRDLGNPGDGVGVVGSDNTIGGTAPAARNLISGNDSTGVLIFGFVTGNKVEGNYIGTNAKGTASLGNTFVGVSIQGATNSTIGGTAAGGGNVITGNGGDGIRTSGGAAGTRIEGNRIGPNAAGTADLGNGGAGVVIFGADNTVGGTISAAGNVIAGNESSGIEFAGGLADGNTVQGNVIRANGNDGVNFFGGDDNTVQGNTIFVNGNDGVEISSTSQGNRIVSNQIFGNTALGIDLVGGTEDGFGVTANDTDDPDLGSNNLQNFPVITSAIRNSNGLTTIAGTLNSNPSQPFTIQCFLATDGDPSNNGEGFLLVAETTTSTNAGGDAGFACFTPVPQSGQEVSATATNSATGDTSEFSENLIVVPALKGAHTRVGVAGGGTSHRLGQGGRTVAVPIHRLRRWNPRRHPDDRTPLHHDGGRGG